MMQTRLLTGRILIALGILALIEVTHHATL